MLVTAAVVKPHTMMLKGVSRPCLGDHVVPGAKPRPAERLEFRTEPWNSAAGWSARAVSRGPGLVPSASLDGATEQRHYLAPEDRDSLKNSYNPRTSSDLPAQGPKVWVDVLFPRNTEPWLLLATRETGPPEKAPGALQRLGAPARQGYMNVQGPVCAECDPERSCNINVLSTKAATTHPTSPHCPPVPSCPSRDRVCVTPCRSLPFSMPVTLHICSPTMSRTRSGRRQLPCSSLASRAFGGAWETALF